MRLKEYLVEIQEQEMGKGGFKKKSSPSFAFELVFKKPPPTNRRGRPPFPVKHKIWKGMEVDAHLEDKWLNDLNRIPNVEIRGTCEGHSNEWVSFIAFRLDPKYDDNKAFLNKVVSQLSKDKNTVVGFDIGTQGRPRFVIATQLYYNCEEHIEWKRWWSTVAFRLNKAVNS